jgi:cyclohexyl-isocyanide hydratase
MTTPFKIGFLIYPYMTHLDVTGPAQVFAQMSDCQVHMVWKTRDPVPTDSAVTLVPTDTLESCPDLDMVCVGGGPGQGPLMVDAAVLAWLARQGAQADYVTSVCSGSLLLGAAGLMKGYRAGSHWTVRDMLPMFGAEPVNERVVTDRNRITGGGVTAGIDFALTIVARLRGEDEAKSLQLLCEYAPEPPFDTGTPERTTPEIAARARAVLDEQIARANAALAPA